MTNKTNTNNDWLSQVGVTAAAETKALHKKYMDTAIATAYVLCSGDDYYHGDKAVNDVNKAERFDSVAAAEKNKQDYDGTCYCQIAKVCQTPDGKWHDVWALDENEQNFRTKEISIIRIYKGNYTLAEINDDGVEITVKTIAIDVIKDSDFTPLNGQKYATREDAYNAVVNTEFAKRITD